MDLETRSGNGEGIGMAWEHALQQNLISADETKV